MSTFKIGIRCGVFIVTPGIINGAAAAGLAGGAAAANGLWTPPGITAQQLARLQTEASSGAGRDR